LSWAAFLLLVAQPADAGPVEAPRIVPDGRCARPSDNLSEDELVVCGRRIEPNRYRLPIRPDRFDPSGQVDSVSRERHRLYEVGDSGIGSCSTVGPGGWTGCAFKKFKADVEQYGK
jgi:hypothetical protein